MHRIVPALALLALVVAGCSGGDGDSAGDGGATDTATTLAVTGTDALTFQPSELSATAGTVSVELTAGAGANHTFVVEGVDGDQPVAEAAAGETATGSVDLSAGTYTAYCSVPGHREAGMQATLNVS